MSIDAVQQKLLTYQCQTLDDQQNALKEIAQEIALMVLSRSGFFSVAAFQGGTSLRILYGLDRFSEDLDFVLKESNEDFEWNNYIKNMQEEFSAYGYDLEVSDKSKMDQAIRKAFIKADSKGGLLILKDARTNKPKLQIKLEVDVNPPRGSTYELKYLDFPHAFSVLAQDLPSMFASKSHALLCRDYVKGRDWFDFVWYVAREVKVNFELLKNAIDQAGPWQGKKIAVDKAWFLRELRNKINEIDWDDAKRDVAQFLRQNNLPSLEVWSKAFFLSRVDKLEKYL